MDEITPSQWIARCAARLGHRWRTIPPAVLEEVAVEIWRDPELRSLAPDAAAAAWLQPLPERATST
jgi:hypothetical protein